MSKRERAKLTESKNAYFVEDKTDYSFVSSGCTLLDCVLGGGFPLGRIVNIVGDKSTAKTALATEALINFSQIYPNGVAAYRDTEAAFDQGYAKAMGLDLDKVDFGDKDEPLITVEQFSHDFDAFLEARLKTETPGIYVVDSLDALSDDAEMERDIEKGTFGAAKAKLLSIFFRKTAHRIEQSRVLLLVISQVRDNIGAMFGEKHKRSGGRALDFYASQILWLAHIETLRREISKVKRPYGVTIKAKCKKNKVSLPFRDCDFQFIFGYGVEDLGASVEWLKEIGRLKDAGINPTQVKDYLKGIDEMDVAEYNKERETVSAAVKQAWREIETSFLPKRAKYQ
jgi:recombination protein RecA